MKLEVPEQQRLTHVWINFPEQRSAPLPAMLRALPGQGS